MEAMMDFRTMTTEQINASVDKLDASIKLLESRWVTLDDELKEKLLVQKRLISAARLELSRRQADVDDIPF